MNSGSHPSALTSPEAIQTRTYALRSDLAQFCLPAVNRDANRKLAYVNSICLLFLAIGVAGLNPAKLEQKTPQPVQEFVPVDIVQPVEPPKSEPPPEEREPEQPADTPVEMPQVVTVVAADPSQVNFAVPVEGPVVFAPARLAQAPPTLPPKASDSKPIKFTGTDGGVYPRSAYPAWARRPDQPLEATATLIITVNPDGSVQSVDIQTHTGSIRVVNYQVEWIKKHYQFPRIDGTELRRYENEIDFHLTK